MTLPEAVGSSVVLAREACPELPVERRVRECVRRKHRAIVAVDELGVRLDQSPDVLIRRSPHRFFHFSSVLVDPLENLVRVRKDDRCDVIFREHFERRLRNFDRAGDIRVLNQVAPRIERSPEAFN